LAGWQCGGGDESTPTGNDFGRKTNKQPTDPSIHPQTPNSVSETVEEEKEQLK
jgi:hypothetical protein